MSDVVDLQVDMEGSTLKMGCRRTRVTMPMGTLEADEVEASELVTIDLDELSAEVRVAIEKAMGLSP